MKEKTFKYYSFDGDGPMISVVNLGNGNHFKWEGDGLHNGDEIMEWLSGFVDGYQRAYNEMLVALGQKEVEFDIEEMQVYDLKSLEKAKQELGELGYWSSEMEWYIENELESIRRKKEKEALKELEEGESYWYCWGFSGVDHISEDSIKDDVVPDFIHKGTRQQAELMAFWHGREDLESYRGLHGVPDEEEMDEDEFFEYANDNVVTFVEEKFAFDKANKDKTWELEI